MDETKSIQEQHTAGAQAIGFDYQFYYFMLLAYFFIVHFMI